jgi:tRNA(fMet)-specific endonuclease VapC
VPVILDTDHVTILQRQGPEADRLLVHLDSLPPDDIATTVVTYQEQLQGWLAFLNRARGDDQLLRAYADLDNSAWPFEK